MQAHTPGVANMQGKKRKKTLFLRQNKSVKVLVSPEEIKSREVELGSESWTCFALVVSQQRRAGHCLCDCCTQQLRQQLHSTLFAMQW